MKHSKKLSVSVFAAGAVALGLAAAPAQSAEDTSVPTFEEFQAFALLDADKQYIVNGDEPIRTRGALRDYYERMVGKKQDGPDRLIVNRVNGRDDVWSQSAVGNLTYCVSDRFRGDKANVVSAMNTGAALWENASSAIDFVYVPAQDGNCTTRNASVVFSVEPTNTQSYIARAFFPSTPKSARNVLVNATSLMNSGSWTPGNIMGHELGHSLGFRHEHTRPEAGTCFEDNNWRPLTPYDSASIMHYPQCNGSSDNLSMTSTDRQGVALIYGS